jgi:membrane fusion protein, multidrug efflux system
MKAIQKAAVLLTILAVISSCGKKNDINAELASLKKQRDELNLKISKLEKEVKASDTTAQIKVINVGVTELKSSEFNHYLEVQGKVDGEENTAVFPSNNAIVTAVFVKQGDMVRKGQVLAQLDNSILLKTIEATKVNVELANTLYEKYKSLWDQQIGSEVQFIQAKTAKESADKQLIALKEQLDLYLVKSPINGSVEELNAKVGMFASPSNPLPLFRVVNFNSVKVLADVSESYASKIKIGNPVKVYFPDFDIELNSQLRYSSKYINPVNRTFSTEVRLGPSKVQYRANMLAIVKINDYRNASALSVPISVVKEGRDGKYLFAAREENGKTIARKLIVEVGETYNGLAEIKSGLVEGDKIITIGYNNLIDGQIILVN